jgi:hypothetical protein
MTAEIILFPRWRMARSSQLPPAIDVAMDHVIWLRFAYPDIAPETAGLMIDKQASTWAEVIEAYAALWGVLPEEIRLRSY